MSPLEAPGGNRFVGQRVQRREDARLLTGHGRFVDDVVVPGMLHGAFLRSDFASGSITRLDVEAARALPGVVGVFTVIRDAGISPPYRIAASRERV